MNIGRAAGKDKRVEIANLLGKLGGWKAQRDFDRLGTRGLGCGEISFVGFSLVLKFFFSSAIRDTYTHLGAGFGGHESSSYHSDCGRATVEKPDEEGKMRRSWQGSISARA